MMRLGVLNELENTFLKGTDLYYKLHRFPLDS